MSSAEVTSGQLDLGFPEIVEDPALELSMTVYTPSEVEGWAERAAKTAHALFNWDEKQVIDTVGPNFEAMVADAQSHNEVKPIIGLKIGVAVMGRAITPTHLKIAHDSLDVPVTSVWGKMYGGRSEAWWNQRLPEGERSGMVYAPRYGLLAIDGLHGVNAKWDKQQKHLSRITEGYKGKPTVIEGMTPTDWLWLDADALVNDDKRPDTQAFTRFVQHERDITGLVGDSGPGAYVDVRRAHLGGSGGIAVPGSGFRLVMGQKQS